MKSKLIIISFLLVLTSVYAQIPDEQLSNQDKVIGVWKVKNGILLENEQLDNKIAKENWKIFYGLFPKKIVQKYIKEIVLFTDGPDEKTGAIASLNDSNKDWQLMLDTADVDFSSNNKEKIRQSIYTLVHEFGHLITLNDTQIKPVYRRKFKRNKEGEPYVTYEGQAYRRSYINQFVNKFWDGALLKEWDFIRKKYCFVEQESCLEQLYGLYQENYTDFLTDYAAESPEEDIVESFTAFVLGEKIPRPQTIAHKKINFFYKFPDLVNFRNIIRKNLAKYE